MSRVSGGSDPVFVDVAEVKYETEKALLCLLEDGRELWIPKSQIIEAESDVNAKGDVGTLAVTEWLAEREGL